MSQELRPRWKGFLLFDEKMCKVRGEQLWFYVAMDSTIIHCEAVNEALMQVWLWQLSGYFLENRIPALRDLKHALGAIEKLIGYKPLESRYQWNRWSLREQFERLPGRKGVWVDRTREAFLRK